jgi:S1-C subfamily serine protease
MKKILLVLALLLLPVAALLAQETPTPAPAPVPVSAEQTELDKAKAWRDKILATEIHAVGVFALGDGMGFCSGVVIETTDTYSKVLTAKHCVNVTEEYYVEQSTVKRIEVSTSDDLALLTTTPIEGKTPVTLATNNEPLGKIIFSLGYPDGENLFIAVGYTLRNTKDWQWARMKVIHGCSGGGVYNENQELIGILWGGLNMEGDKPGMAIFEPISDVRKFLSETGYQPKN